MAGLLTDAQVYGPALSGDNAPAKPLGLLSDADVYGGAASVAPPADPMQGMAAFGGSSPLLGQFAKQGQRGTVAGLPAELVKGGEAVGDMFLGAPASVVGWSKGVGAALTSAAAGQPKTQVFKDLMSEDLPPIPVGGHQVPLEVLKTPLQSLHKMIVGGEPLDQSKLAEVLEKAAASGEAKTGVPKEIISKTIGAFMNFAGLAGLHAATKLPPTKPAELPTPPAKPRLRGPAAAAEELQLKPRLRGPAAEARVMTDAEVYGPPPAVFRSGRELAATAPFLPPERVTGIKQYLQRNFGDKEFSEYTKPQIAVATATAAGAGTLLGSQMDPDQLEAFGGLSAMFIPVARGDARLNAYEKMKASGASRLKRWRSTGITELPGIGPVREGVDVGARLKLEPRMVNGKAVAWLAAGHELPLGEVLDHPELFKTNPELKNLLVRPTNQPGMAGEYHPRTGTIYINYGSPAEVTSTLLHEVNHYFVPGGSPKQFKARGIAEPTATQLYEKIPGEVLARATERRMKMTAEERLQTPPWESFDVPEERWIRQFGGEGPSAAVKEKGGMWHPEAVARLASPLQDRLVPGRGAAEARNMATHNALRDMGLGPEHLARLNTAQLQELSTRVADLYGKSPEGIADNWATKSIRNYLNKHAGTATDPLRDIRIPMLGEDVRWEDVTDKAIRSYEAPAPTKTGGETRWALEQHGSPINALQSYLSHVGDYLREFVPPARLQQYDLVRAVRETAQQDARQAAKMAKARASGAGTTLYKDYGDGMKWVEVGTGKDRAVADAALKNEGDTMGHCVGGYCEMVHQGQSKIYSLRDAKGMSHVTVEVRPEGSPTYPADSRTMTSDILQIKGKQNRAPVAAYLPYVQDFVKSGKWGEVGDLANAGMVKTQRGYEVKAELEARGEKWQGGGPGFEHWGPPDQRGAADPRQLAAIAAAGAGAAAGAALNPDHPWLGGALGAVAGAGALHAVPLVGKGLMDATRAALQSGSLYERATRAAGELIPGPISRAFARDSRIRIKAQMDAAEVFTRREELKANRAVNQVLELAPREADRAAVSHAIESGQVGGLPPPLQRAAGVAQTMFSELGEKGLAAGTIKDLLEQYVTHVFPREALPLIDEMLRERNLGTASSVFGKARRGPPTIAEVNAWMAKKGQAPITADIAKIMTAYSNSMIKAIANRTLIDTLKQTSMPAVRQGKTIQRAVVTTKPIGNYVPLGKYNLYVHPDILPALRFVFEQDSSPGIMRGVEAVNTALKRTAVSFSLFHAKSLVDAMVGGARLAKGPLLAGALAGGMYAVASDKDPVTYAMIGAGLGMAGKGLKLTAQAAAPKLFGENRFVRALRTGDPAMAKLIDLSFEGGLQYSLKGGGLAVEEASKGFYEGLEVARQGLDKLVPGAGKAVRGVEVVNRAMDTFMWDRLHTAMKLEVFAEKYETLLMNNAKAHSANPAKVPLMSEVQLAEAAASYTNDIFGGLNWRRIAEEGFTRWGRDLKMGVYRPSGRRILRLAMFAPDWTISTTRAALKAFGGLVGQPQGSGFRGLLEPRTVADLHRQYMLRSIFYYAVVGDGLNMAFTGHHLWQNKDPTYIELADGRKMQFSKHTMEPYHWIQHPVQQALNKLGQVPKEALNQMFGTEYLNPRVSQTGKQVYAGPEMKEGRAKHLLQQLSPIGVQQFAEGPVGGVTGAVGMPIYGRTREQIEAERKARKGTAARLEAARKRREKALAR